jgi:hypothetical protein
VRKQLHAEAEQGAAAADLASLKMGVVNLEQQQPLCVLRGIIAKLRRRLDAYRKIIVENFIALFACIVTVAEWQERRIVPF